MPGMNGYEVAFRVQQNPDYQSLVEQECKVRVDGIIRKPVDPETLLAQVQAILQCTNYCIQGYVAETEKAFDTVKLGNVCLSRRH